MHLPSPLYPMLWLAACLLGLGGCAAGGRPGAAPAPVLQHLSIVATPDANGNAATAVDLVWVFSPEALAAMPHTGPQWFDQKAALQAGPAGDLAVQSLALPPATALDSVSLPTRHASALAVLAFVNFSRPAGQAVGKLGAYACARITLSANSVDYSACP